MKIKLAHITIFVLFIVTGDIIFGNFLRYCYDNTPSGPNYSLNYSFLQSDEEIIVLGNSRAQHHYNDRIIYEKTGLLCFNGGIDGGHSIFLPYSQLISITKRYTPRVVILEYSPMDIYFNERDYDNIRVLLPYYEIAPEIDNIILKKSILEEIKLFSTSYKYNSTLFDYFYFNLRKQKVDGTYNGFVPLYSKLNTISSEVNETNIGEYYIDSNKISILNNFVNLCKEKAINLLLINSPMYKGNYDENWKYAKNYLSIYCARKNLIFLDYSDSSEFSSHSELFSDRAHLNIGGAMIYSNSVSNKIIASFLNK